MNKNQTALITGSSKGIGYAIANKLASEGIHLILVSRNIIDLESVKSELLEKFPVIQVSCYAADLSNRDQCIQLGKDISQHHPEVNILINNAGTYTTGNIIDGNEEDLENLMNINFYAAFHLTRSIIPVLQKNTPAIIINNCSIAGLDPYKNGSLYCITKFALNGFSRCLREELKMQGIKVCTLYPGATWSDSWRGSNIDQSRIMKAEDIAEMVSSVIKLHPSAVVEEIVIRPQLGDL